MYTIQSDAEIMMPASITREFLTFNLGSEEYGIDIQKIQELRSMEAITRIASTPEFVIGVINLRGIIVPVIDVGTKLKIDRDSSHDPQVIIILNVENRILGITVDSVSDVTILTSEHIKPAPPMHMNNAADYLIGIGTKEGRMLILIDIERLIPASEMDIVDHIVD